MRLRQIIRLLLSILVFDICLSVLPTHAQNIGIVDTRILLILHPLMENYDYINEKFFRDTNPNKDVTDILNKIQKAQKEAEVKNAELDEEIKKLQQENCEVVTALNREKFVFAAGDVEKLKKTKSQLEATIKSLKNNYAPGKVSVEQFNKQIQDFETRIAEIDALLKNPASVKSDNNLIKKYEDRLKEIEKRIQECKLKQYENLDSSMDAMYLSRKETNERLIKIQKDIKEIISKVAEKEKCNLVIDNTFAVRDPVRTNRKVINTQISAIADVNTTTLFHSFTNYELTEEEAIKRTGIKDGKEAMNHMLMGSINSNESNLKSYLYNKDYIPAKVADFTFGSMFISGGKDLTSECAKYIFNKYNVSDFIKQRYDSVLKEYLIGKGEYK